MRSSRLVRASDLSMPESQQMGSITASSDTVKSEEGVAAEGDSQDIAWDTLCNDCFFPNLCNRVTMYCLPTSGSKKTYKNPMIALSYLILHVTKIRSFLLITVVFIDICDVHCTCMIDVFIVS